MPTITRNDLSQAPTGAETRITPAGRNDTPLPSEFPYLRPPQGPGELGRLGGYRVLKLLGSGGMGKVFLAEDLGLKRAIALKVMCLPPGEDLLSWRERFLREARAQAGTRHPNLVTVFQVGEDRGTVFIAMELLEGETLEARVRRATPLPVPEALTIAEDVLRGLAAIHAHGLIHRDIKPANIWLTAGGPSDAAPADETDPLCFHEPAPRPASVVATPAKILDFGLVREARTGTQLTEAGAVVGTPAFMSPEQARGRELDHRTDLFSFGCVLYAMVTGRPPFVADTPMAQAAALAADDPVPARKLNRGVSRGLSDLIADLLAKEPDDRPASADDVLYRLQTLDESPAPKGGTAPRRALREGGDGSFRKYAIMGVAAACVVVAVLAAVAAAVSLNRDSAAADKEKDKVEKAEKVEKPKPAAAPKPAKPPEPAADYLADMPVRWEVKYPPPDRPQPPALSGPPLLSGTRSPRSILMHASPPGTDLARRAFAPNGAHTRFVADVGFNDSALPGASPVVFVVLSGSDPLWESEPMVVGRSPVRCDVKVEGRKALELGVFCLGDARGAHAVWIDPRLIK